MQDNPSASSLFLVPAVPKGFAHVLSFAIIFGYISYLRLTVQYDSADLSLSFRR